MSMALKGPQLGLGRTKSLERKRKKKGELLFLSNPGASVSLEADRIGR